jgi:hypothetical protein
LRGPPPPLILFKIAIAAQWVHAIWITSAHSTSPSGFAPTMNARLAFTAISEIPLFGSRAAAN